MMMKKLAAGGGSPSPSRDRLFYNKYDDFGLKKTLPLYKSAPAPAGEGSPTLNRGPHPC